MPGDTIVLMIISIMLFIAIIIVIERSYKIFALQKIIASQELQIKAYKNQKEDFAISIAKTKNLPHNVLFDPLTHLLSKDAFENQYTHLLNQSKRFNSLFAVLMIDINQFSRIKETYSPSVSDTLLIEAGERLKKTLRDVDILTKYENDIFIAVLPNMIKPEVVVHAVERIMHVLNMPFEVNGDNVELTIGIGIAIYPFDGEDQETLIAHAKIALEKSKATGKNVFQFYQEETQKLGKRELDLKAAIKSKDFLQDVNLEFKPYFNTLTNEIDCFEIDASLNHPELGKIPFSELARISHYSSRMFELYEWMMTHALEKCISIKSQTLKQCNLIFKFDLKQFAAPQFADKLIELINKLSKSEKIIIIELLDESDHGNLEVYRESISKLSNSGIPLVIGILVLGYFALNKLNQIHFNYLKVDEKLVHDLTVRAESKLILGRILSLVDNLKLGTLTSGVDTNEQKKMLETMGCTLMQGKAFKELRID